MMSPERLTSRETYRERIMNIIANRVLVELVEPHTPIIERSEES